MVNVMERFPTEEACITYLETMRWGDRPVCPHCGSEHVARKKVGDKTERWNCHDKFCKSTFTVKSGTLFNGTQIELKKWFLAVSLVMNAKKGISSHQLGRDLNVPQPTALNMQRKIRHAMKRKASRRLLHGIIEADETFVGGKPRRRKDKDGNVPPPSKRGRGTKKTKVLGAVQRGGEVIARVVTDLSSSTIGKFITSCVQGGSTLVTDEYKGYTPIKKIMKHEIINHQKRQYVDPDNPDIHTNTIEGFWSLVKRSWYGTHHHYSKKYAPLYIAEACYKYNHRHTENLFDVFIKDCLS